MLALRYGETTAAVLDKLYLMGGTWIMEQLNICNRNNSRIDGGDGKIKRDSTLGQYVVERDRTIFSSAINHLFIISIRPIEIITSSMTFDLPYSILFAIHFMSWCES